LLEAAAMSPRPAVQPMTLALRRSLSAAVVVLAVAVAGLAYITAQTRPQSVGAEVAQLEVQWQEVQEQLASGQPVATNVIVELTTRSTALAGKLSNDSAAPAPVAEKLGAIIDSQQVVVNEVATAASPELQQVQEQLNQAEEKVRIVAAAASPIAQPSTTAASPTTAPSSTRTPRSTATARPGPTATPLPLQPRQVSIRLDPSDTTYGMSWTAVRTANMSFAIPTSWEITNLVVNANGIANLDSNFIFISGEEANVIVNTQNAEILATIDGGPRVVLRTEGKNGKLIDLEALVAQAEEVALELRHLLTSLKLTGSLAD
jgi:hypothetical protein